MFSQKFYVLFLEFTGITNTSNLKFYEIFENMDFCKNFDRVSIKNKACVNFILLPVYKNSDPLSDIMLVDNIFSIKDCICNF